MTEENTDNVDADFPSLSPSAERDAPENPAFVEDCLASLDGLKKLGAIEVGSRLLTESEKWGLVFRADFTVNHTSNGNLIDRLICWKQMDGHIGTIYAVGQNIPPLAPRDSGGATGPRRHP